MKLHEFGDDKDVFVYLHSYPRAHSVGIYVDFVTADRNEEGAVALNYLHSERLFRMDEGCRTLGIAAVDIDGDGSCPNEFAILEVSNKHVHLHFYTTNYQNGQLNVWQLHDHYIQYDNDEAFDEDADKRAIAQLVAGDFDGDGKDELAILFLAGTGGRYYPKLGRWYCDYNSIKPKRDMDTVKGKAGDSSLLGVSFSESTLSSCYYVTEAFSITAGPLTGTQGKAKLVDDVVISWTDDYSRVYVIPTKVDGNKNFAGFGDTKKIYEDPHAYPARGAVLTSDFANEVLRLANPIHTVDDHDQSFTAVLRALPYHVDNVDLNGNLTAYPINYTFSGFEGDGGNGKMSVTYRKSSTSSETSDVTFNMASTTETISLLGDAGKYVHGYLKFHQIQANIAGNFDERAKMVSQGLNMVMDFVTDKIDETTTNSTKEAKQFTSTSTMTALFRDYIVMYYAPQHMWRYRILNDPLPKWFVYGAKSDYSSGEDLGTESQARYLSFSMYDDVKKVSGPSDQNSYYQMRHEEGNFFSYPSTLEDSEAYCASGVLSEPKHIVWSKGVDTSETVEFQKSKIESQIYEDNIQKSGLTKTVSAIATFFGADDPDKLPKYTSHSETFSKGLSTSELIDVQVYGRSTLPGEEAQHTLSVVPYIAREGTMMVGTAVTLTEGAKLWREGRYQTYADPALVLPQKYKRNGATFMSDSDNLSAMKLRGLRFYVPALDLDSDNTLLAGLTYKISVPVYNASFKDTGTFKVKLSYGTGTPDLAPDKTANLTEIQTIDMSLGGWENQTSGKNHGWAEFTWDIPENMGTFNGYFFVQIDPKNDLTEGHESRLNADGTIADVGGNNEGYFSFAMTSAEDAERKQTANASVVSAIAKETKDGVLYREVFRKGEDDLQFVYVLGLLSEMAEVSMDASFPIQCEIRYDGDEYYPEVLLCGVNYKEEAFERIGKSIDRISELTHEDIDDDPEPEPVNPDPIEPDPVEPNNNPGSSSGGCYAFTGSIMLLALIGLMKKR